MSVDLDLLRKEKMLEASTDELYTLYDILQKALKGMSEEQRFNFLRIAEQEILGNLGHKAGIRFGEYDYANENKCVICGGDIEMGDRHIMVTSDWETSKIWLPYHERCIDGREYEVEFDLITGRPTTKIGLP